jgi:predicted protein tyrosine phosphatase
MNKNIMAMTHNPFQGKFKKVLCVCSAGLLRSPTAALVLSMPPFNFNTRSCGLSECALVTLDEVLLHWADEVVCMDGYQKEKISQMTDKPVCSLDIGDVYDYRDPELMEIIKSRYENKDAIKQS